VRLDFLKEAKSEKIHNQENFDIAVYPVGNSPGLVHFDEADAGFTF
jgi:hypothetical protein